MAIKGGGTKKVCLPYAKYKSMSRAEKQKVISAKRSLTNSDLKLENKYKL